MKVGYWKERPRIGNARFRFVLPRRPEKQERVVNAGDGVAYSYE